MALVYGPTGYQYIVAGGAAVIGVFVLLKVVNSPAILAEKSGNKLPPGPEQSFLLGNLLNFPKARWGETFTRWQKEYGDLIYVNLAGKPLIVLNSMQAAEELMEKRMNLYSQRPYKAMTNELMHAGWSIVSAQPGPHFYEQRKVFRKAIGVNAILEYDEMINHQIAPFLQALDGVPEDPFEAIMSNVGAVIVKAGYGENIYREHGKELARVNRVRSEMITRVYQTFWLVDVFPFLRHIPPWFPGAKFRRIGVQGTAYALKVRHWAFSLVEKAVAEGNADDSIVSKHLNDAEFSNGDLRDAVAAMYSAGTDTTSTSIINFFYSMLANPEAQGKVHNELDAVIGEGRAPSISDIQNLDYFNAAWKESKRLNTPAPLGLPHLNSEADVWNGFYIPKGSVIFCNIGFMLRDPRIWGEDSESYKPERFLLQHNPRAAELPDMTSLPFGFGRRLCPGRFLAERVGLQFAAAVVAAYEIVPLEGESTSKLVEFDDGTIRRPSNFRCQFKRRH